VILEKSIESAISEAERESLKKKLETLLNNRQFMIDVTRQVVDMVIFFPIQLENKSFYLLLYAFYSFIYIDFYLTILPSVTNNVKS
jgi:hypothetical protein